MHRRRPVVACPPVIYYSEDGEQESFVKHRLLGYGGFAAVYEVERVSDGCRMAAKVLPLSSLADSNKLRRVQNEIDINQLLHHPHVVTFLGSFQDEHNVYLLQELCCITLSELLKHVGRMSELQAAHILWQVLSALEHLHGCRVAHRDLKLSNMFLARDGTAKVGDLGLACHLPTPASRRRSTCGSLNWMAPEVLRPGAAGYGLEVDIWALGVMLFTLLVGRPPFAGGGRDSAGGGEDGGAAPQTTCSRILAGRYRMPGPEEVELGPEAHDLVARLLVVDPAARPTLEQLRGHAFFQVHLGPLATSWTAAAGPVVGAGAGSSSLGTASSRWASGPQSPLLERGGSGSFWGERWGPAAAPASPATALAGDAGGGNSSLPSPCPSLQPALDIRLVLCEAGLAALAASAAGVGGDSTSGSYMELSQSEQCSVTTAASTTTTIATGGGGRLEAPGGALKWQLSAHDTLSAQLSGQSHDASSRTRSHAHLPAYRMSEQITGGVSCLHGGAGASQGKKPHAMTSRLYARGSVPNSVFYPDRSLSISGTELGCGGGGNASTPSLCSLTHGTGGTDAAATPTHARLLASVESPSFGQGLQQEQPPPQLQDASQHQHQEPYSGPHHHQHQGQPFLLPPRQEPPPAPSSSATGSSKTLPGAGADQDLPHPGLDVYRAHAHAHSNGIVVSPFHGGAAVAAMAVAACAHAAAHPRGNDGVGKAGEPPDLDASRGDAAAGAAASSIGSGCRGLADRPTWSRSCTGLTPQGSAFLNSRSTTSSLHVASFAQAALGQGPAPQQQQQEQQQQQQPHQAQLYQAQPYPHTHHQHVHKQCGQQRHHHPQQDPRLQARQQQQQQQQQQPEREPSFSTRRRRSVDSAAPPAGAIDGATSAAAEPHSGGGDDGSGGGGDGVERTTASPPPPTLSVLRAAFLSQYSTYTHANASQARRLQATRSGHARDSMRIAAGLRSVPGAGGDDPENDRSSDTVRSYADSLEAMLLGGNGRAAGSGSAGGGGGVGGGITRSGPAPLAPSRQGHSHAIGYALASGLSPTGAAPSVPSMPSGPIVLRHARSSIGGPSTRRGAAAVSAASVAGFGGGAAAAPPPLLSEQPRDRAAPLPSWPQADGATARRAAHCVTSLSSGLASSQLLSSNASSDAAAAAAAASMPAPRSLPAALGAPPPSAPMPQYKPPSQAGGHHSSSATTPQHSEPLSLAVFAIQQSKGLPVRGTNSPPPGLDGPVLDAGLCICSAADSPLRDGHWSGEQAHVRGAGAGTRTAGVGAASARSQSGAPSDAAVQALEAARAVAGLDLCAAGAAAGEPASPLGFGRGSCLQRRANPAACASCDSASQQQLLRPNARSPGAAAPLGEAPPEAQQPEELAGAPSEGGSGRELELGGGVCYTAPGAIRARRGSAGTCLPRSEPPGRQSPQGKRQQQQQASPQQQQRRSPRTFPAFLTSRRATSAPEAEQQRWQGQRQVSSAPQQQGQGQEQQEAQEGQQQGYLVQQGRAEQGPLLQRRAPPKACGSAGASGFTLRMHMHPWRAMALTRIRREAMQLHRLQRDEAEEAEGAASEAAPEEWGEARSRSFVSAAPLESLRLRQAGEEAAAEVAAAMVPDPRTQPVAAVAGSWGAGGAVAVAAAAAPEGAPGEVWTASAASARSQRTEGAEAAPQPRQDGGQAPAAAPGATVSPGNAVAATMAPAAVAAGEAVERLWTASASAGHHGCAPCASAAPDGGCGTGSCAGPCAAARTALSTAAGRCGEASAPPAAVKAEEEATGLGLRAPLAAGVAAAAAASAAAAKLGAGAGPGATAAGAAAAPPRKQTMCSGWSLDRLGFCCPRLYGSGPVSSPATADPSPFGRGGGGEAQGRGEAAAVPPKRRFASLDVERVLRHLESCDPDDVAVVQCTTLSHCTTTDSHQTQTPASTVVAAPAPDGQPPADAKLPAQACPWRVSGGGATAAATSTPSRMSERGLGHTVDVAAVSRARAGGSETPEVVISLAGMEAQGGPAAAAAAAAVALPSALYFTTVGSRGTGSVGAGLDTRGAGERSERRSVEELMQALGCDARASGGAIAAAVAGAAPPAPEAAGVAVDLPPVPPLAPPPPPPCGSPLLPLSMSSLAPRIPVAAPPGGARGASFTGMRGASNGGMLPDAVPEMDPEALAELASRLRSKSFKDGMCGSRNGSFTYRPSRMMPAAQRSPSRRGGAASGGIGASPAVSGQAAAPPGSDGAPPPPPALADGAAVAPESLRSRAGDQVHPREVLMVKWLDYSSKYGLSYVLSNGAVGVLFRDGSQLLRIRGDAYAWLIGAPAPGGGGGSGTGKRGALVQPQGLSPQAQPLLVLGDDSAAASAALAAGNHHQHHDVIKKLRLLRSFEEMLLGSPDGGVDVTNGEARLSTARQQREFGAPEAREEAAAAPPPAKPPTVFVSWWTRTQKALVLCMSSGTLQALFCDGSELVLREAEDEVEFLARDGRRTSCSLRAARQAGSNNSSLSKRIQYASLLLHSRAGKH